jgi:TRAP-type transport system small permease protein
MAELTRQLPRQPAPRFRSTIMRISKGMVVISCLMLTVMLVISTADVAGRYFFTHPIDGTFEIVSMSFVICGAFAIGYTQLVKGHIAINILTDRLKPRAQKILLIISHTISLAVCILVAWQGWGRMIDYYHKTLGGETLTLGMPLWPFMLMFALGFFWIAVIFIIDIYDTVREVAKR